MSDFQFLPLIADGIGTFISMLFLFIAFIGWVLNLLSSKNQPAPPPPGPRPRPRQQPRRDRRVQDEIEVFLRDVSQGRTPPSQTLDVDDEEPALEIVEEHQPTLAERRQQREREAAAPELTNELQEHLQNYLARDREAKIASSANVPFVPGSAGLPRSQASSIDDALMLTGLNSDQLVALLRSPNGMRQGILMAEILGRPVSQRKP